MKIVLNGESYAIQRAKNVMELVGELELPAPTLLIEHNGIALRREEWPEQILHEGDRLEMIKIVAGG